MRFRAATIAMNDAKEIASNENLDAGTREALVEKVLDLGQSAGGPKGWDIWAQRIVASALGLIGIVIAVMIGVAQLDGLKVNAAFYAALTAVAGGLAGMFAQQALNRAGGNGSSDDSNTSSGGGEGGTPPVKKATAKKAAARKTTAKRAR
jgi:hypothetical protein